MPSADSRKESFPHLFQFLRDASIPWPMDTSLQSLLSSSQHLLCMPFLCVSFITTLATGFRTHGDNPRWSSYSKVLNLIRSVKLLFQITTFPGSRDSNVNYRMGCYSAHHDRDIIKTKKPSQLVEIYNWFKAWQHKTRQMERYTVKKNMGRRNKMVGKWVDV